MMFRCFLILLVLCNTGIQEVIAQDFVRSFDIPVEENNINLLNPWSGGLNFSQYSVIDLNQDSKEDLFVFDREGQKVLTFVFTENTEGEFEYIYAPQYEAIFPSDLSDWVILYDFNCDGLKDIFTSASAGMAVYSQKLNNGVISFEIEHSLLSNHYGFESAYAAPLYNVSNDLPAITDIDGDGDTDILSFSPSSNTIYYYINSASDLNRCDTLIMSLGNACYGDISESQTTDAIELGVECINNVVDVKSLNEFKSSKSVHLGGTLSSIDLNGDGRNELFIGDSTSEKIIRLTNSESSEQRDSMVMISPNFPAGLSDDQAIGFYQFPGLYFHDFNNDGLVDVASSSFHSFGAQDDESSWLYLNIGKENDPNFQLISKSWLQEDMIEHGSNAHPCFVDYNGDGLMDLVIGNRFTVLGNDNIYSSLRLYENIGSETNPEFSLIDEDWLNLSASGFSEIHPTFGDIDNDSDLDLIIGEENGRLYLFRNESGTSTEITVSDNEQILENNLDNLDFGIGSKPQLVDLNQDGMLDLVVGELFGRIYYVQNTGTADEFSFSVITENLGNISIDGDVFEANVVPYMYLNQGEWNLVVGNMNGHVQRYVSAGDLSNDFIRIDQELFSANDGTFSSPTVFDIDGDGYQDLIIGNARGGVSLYKGQFFDQVHEIRQSEVLIYPNPTGDALSIHLNEGSIFRSIQLYTVHGTLQMNIKFSGRSSKSIDLSDLADGVYILNIETEEGQLKKKIVKNSGLSH